MRLGETDGIGRKQMLPTHEAHLPPPVGQGQSSPGASAVRMEQGLKTQFRVSEPWALTDFKTLGFGRIPGFYKISSYPNKRKWALWFWGLILLQFSLLN